MNRGSNRRGSNEEMVIVRDRPGRHPVRRLRRIRPIGNSCYNCFKVDEIATRNGFTKLGVQNVGALITRGVLIDVAALQGRRDAAGQLRDHGGGSGGRAEEAEPDAAARRRRHHPHRLGQAVGQGQRALREVAARASASRPRSGWSPRIRCCSAPTTGRSRSRPIPIKQISLPVHQIALVVNGIHLLENLKLDELAAKRRVRVRLRHAAAEDPGRHRLDRGADRGAVIDVVATRGTRGGAGVHVRNAAACSLRGRDQTRRGPRGAACARFRSPA